MKTLVPLANRTYILYLVINKVTNKKYVGQTCKRLSKRWGDHLSSSRLGKDSYFAASIRKHGQDQFVVMELERVVGRLNADDRERYFIKLFNLTDRSKGYNCTTGGDGGKILSIESRQKLSKSLKAKNIRLTDHQKQALRTANYGKKRPKEVVAKIAWANSRKDVVPQHVYDLYVSGGFNTFEIAKMFGCTQCTVWTRLKRMNAPMREGRGVNLPQFKSHLSTEEILRLYFDEKVPADRIGHTCGVSVGTILRRIRDAGRSPRSRGESMHFAHERRRKACQQQS